MSRDDGHQRGRIVGLLAGVMSFGLAGSALAAPGDYVWTSRYDAPAHSEDSAYAIAVSPDGTRLFVAGGSEGSGTVTDFATVAYDAGTGTVQWTKRYDGPGSGVDYARAIAVSPDGGRVFVTGTAYIGDAHAYATIAYDASTGSRLWLKRYQGAASGGNLAYDLAVSPDGTRVFVTGESWGARGGKDFATVAYGAETGAVLWTKRYDGPAHALDRAEAVAVSPNGRRVFVTGSSAGNWIDYATIAYRAATGAELWTKRYDGRAGKSDYASAMDVSPDGRVIFVTGASGGWFTGEDFATIAYRAGTGERLWVRRYDEAGGQDGANDVAVSPTGTRVFVTGSSESGGLNTFDIATVAYEAETGAVLWTKRYDGPANWNDMGGAIDLSPDARKLFVTGASAGLSTGPDYVTLAYRAGTGRRLWTGRYDGANGADYPGGSAMSPDGSLVFVTGGSEGAGTSFDFATIAYEA